MTHYTPDQREALRPTDAESFLLEAHRLRAANLEVALAMMVGRSLARELAEESSA